MFSLKNLVIVVSLLMSSVVQRGFSQLFRSSKSFQILEVPADAITATIPCIYNDQSRRRVLLFHNRTLVDTENSPNYDPKTGFAVQLKPLPINGDTYECRVPSHGGEGDYTIVRVVPQWGLWTQPENTQKEIFAEQGLNISCASNITVFRPLVVVHNYTETVRGCSSQTNELKCILPNNIRNMSGRYDCIIREDGPLHSNSSILQYQLLASWNIRIIGPEERTKVELQLSSSKERIICRTTKGANPRLQSCSCRDDPDCARIFEDMGRVAPCAALTQRNCEVHEVVDTTDEEEAASGNRIKSTSVTGIETAQVYRCFAAVRTSTINCAHASLIVHPKGSGPSNVVVIVISVISVLLLITISLAVFYRQKFVVEKFKVQKLTEREIYEFIHGNQSALDSERDMGEQAHLLPYDQSLEFPRNKLSLGKELGSGAYGTVYLGTAYGLFDRDTENPTTVAVKTINPHADDMYFRALLTELKIMAYIGNHINVVSLLACITGNIESREVFLIMEFCRYGNLHEFLNTNAETFTSQLIGGHVDPTMRKSRSSSRISGKSAVSGRADGSQHYENAWEMGSSPKTSGEAVELEIVESEPLWRTNLEGDYENNGLMEFNTTTLLTWSYQISKGMAYLASKRIIHGDLATRNVLIADGHVVKVADFGLARQVYLNPEYTKTQKNPLPIKWMALESLTRMVFSSQSDVWAFAVTLWEIFSLGESPYPGMQIGEEFVEALKKGYRMKKPSQCPTQLFKLMEKCWLSDPHERPTFEEICRVLSEMLSQKSPDYANLFPVTEDGEPTYDNL